MICNRKAAIEDQFKSPYTGLFQMQKEIKSKKFSEISHKPVIAEAVKAVPLDSSGNAAPNFGKKSSLSGISQPTSSFSKTVKERRTVASAGVSRRPNAHP